MWQCFYSVCVQADQGMQLYGRDSVWIRWLENRRGKVWRFNTADTGPTVVPRPHSDTTHSLAGNIGNQSHRNVRGEGSRRLCQYAMPSGLRPSPSSRADKRLGDQEHAPRPDDYAFLFRVHGLRQFYMKWASIRKEQCAQARSYRALIRLPMKTAANGICLARNRLGGEHVKQQLVHMAGDGARYAIARNSIKGTAGQNVVSEQFLLVSAAS